MKPIDKRKQAQAIAHDDVTTLYRWLYERGLARRATLQHAQQAKDVKQDKAA